MAVSIEAYSQSHPSYDTIGSFEESSFSWTHTQLVPKTEGILVFTFNNSNADDVSAVSYGGKPLTAVASGRAVDTVGQTRDCKAWFSNDVPEASLTPDGLWNYYNIQDFGSYTIEDIAYGNGYWVAVGGVGTLRWATAPTGPWNTANTTALGSNDLFAVTYENGYWVTCGSNGILGYATSPTGTWSTATTGTTNALRDVAYGNNQWIAGGVSGTVIYRNSTAPTGTWTNITTAAGFNTAHWVLAITYNNGNYVASDTAGQVRYSTALSTSNTWSVSSAGLGFAGDSIRYNNNYWVVSGGSGNLQYATSLTSSWVSPTKTFTGTVYATEYLNGYWVGVDGNGIIEYTTSPQIAWKQSDAANTVTDGFRGVAYGNGYWVAVGAKGAIRYTTGGPKVTVTRTNNTNKITASAISVSANYLTETTGTTLEQEDQTLTETNVNDGSPGSNSLRFAAVNSGVSIVDLTTTSTASNTLVRGNNSTALGDFSISTLQNNYLVSTTSLSTTASGSTITSGNTTSSSTSFSTARTLIRTTSTALYSGRNFWKIKYKFSAMSTSYETRFKLQRRNSSAVVQSESSYTTVRSAIGTYSDELDWTPGTWASTDQLAIVWEHRNTVSDSTLRSSTLDANGSSYIIAQLNSISYVMGVVGETTAGQGSRPVGFKTTSTNDIAAVYLAVREVMSDWSLNIAIQ